LYVAKITQNTAVSLAMDFLQSCVPLILQTLLKQKSYYTHVWFTVIGV